MKNKIICILFVAQFILIIMPLSVTAGDEQNPEITDDENDTFGIPRLPIPKRSLKSIDLLSVWFYENPNESDYLFIVVKVVDLNYLPVLRSIYSVICTYDEVTYLARLSTQFAGSYFVAIVGVFNTYKFHLISATFDRENNFVTLKIPKNLIGDPSPGEVLTQTRAWTTLKFGGFGFDFTELAKDVAPNSQSSGKNYVIQY